MAVIEGDTVSSGRTVGAAVNAITAGSGVAVDAAGVGEAVGGNGVGDGDGLGSRVAVAVEAVVSPGPAGGDVFSGSAGASKI